LLFDHVIIELLSTASQDMTIREHEKCNVIPHTPYQEAGKETRKQQA
jgi:hypothetical protein